MSTITNRIAGTAASVVALSALVLAPTAANAQATTVRDGADATGSLSDIHTVTAKHGPNKVKVKVHFADLRRVNDSTSSATIFLDTSAKRPGPEFRVSTGLEEGTDYQLMRVRNWKTVGNPMSCAHKLRLKYAKDNLVFWVNRGCLGSPAKARVGVKMVDPTDGSHVITDWMKGKRQFTRWLAKG